MTEHDGDDDVRAMLDADEMRSSEGHDASILQVAQRATHEPPSVQSLRIGAVSGRAAGLRWALAAAATGVTVAVALGAYVLYQQQRLTVVIAERDRFAGQVRKLEGAAAEASRLL